MTADPEPIAPTDATVTAGVFLRVDHHHGGAAVPPWFIYTIVLAGPKRMDNQDEAATQADLWVTQLVDDNATTKQEDDVASNGGNDGGSKPDGAPAAKESAATVTVGDRNIKF